MQNRLHMKQVDKFIINTNIKLGRGSTGCVYQGYQIETKQKVAIKVVEKWTINNNVAEFLLKMEKKALMTVDNKYLLQGLKIVQDVNNVYLITQFCNGGTLKNYILNSPSRRLSQEKALKIFFCLLRGCKSLSQKGILHRDLKPANIMFAENLPKIIDYGYCDIHGFSKPPQKYNVGSPSYMAPESHQHNIYSEKTEIWALGVILFEMLTGRTIDDGRRMVDVYYQLQTRGVPYPQHISQFPRKVINWCLKTNPKNRPTFLELIETCFPKPNKSKTENENNVVLLGMKAFESQKGSQKTIQKQEMKEQKIMKSKTRHENAFDLNKIIECLEVKKQKQDKQNEIFEKIGKKQIESYQKHKRYNPKDEKCKVPRKNQAHSENKNELRFLRVKEAEQKVNWNYEEMAKTRRQIGHQLRDVDDYIWKSTHQNHQQTRNRFISNKLIPSQKYTPKNNTNIYQMIFEEEQIQKQRCYTQRADIFRA